MKVYGKGESRYLEEGQEGISGIWRWREGTRDDIVFEDDQEGNGSFQRLGNRQRDLGTPHHLTLYHPAVSEVRVCRERSTRRVEEQAAPLLFRTPHLLPLSCYCFVYLPRLKLPADPTSAIRISHTTNTPRFSDHILLES